jgi:MoxR-like ATPase
MSYSKLFDPSTTNAVDPQARPRRLGDSIGRSPYVYHDDIVLAVNVALATGRPLLIGGDPGTGKSSLASDVAARLGWRFYAKTISSRTQARDLLWAFETIHRLSDAQSERRVRHPSAYINPGVLWWAFDQSSAQRRGLSAEAFARLNVAPPGQRPEVEPASMQTPNAASAGAVVLLDESDKADPDVPNDLLEPLGSLRFRVIEGDLDVPVGAAQAPLVFITSNGERELPKAFLRRCIAITLESPNRERLLEIAAAHFPQDAKDESGTVPLHSTIADSYFELRKGYTAARIMPPSTAEYLDAVSACHEMQVRPGTPGWNEVWPKIAAAALDKGRKG